MDGLGPGQLVGRQVLGAPSLGDIQLSLCHQKGFLEVEVIRARGLQVSEEVEKGLDDFNLTFSVTWTSLKLAECCYLVTHSKNLHRRCCPRLMWKCISYRARNALTKWKHRQHVELWIHCISSNWCLNSPIAVACYRWANEEPKIV